MPFFTRSVSRTELAKLALEMVVGRYILIGLPQRRPDGCEKLRSDGRKSSGSVSATAGAVGSSEAALSGAFSPAPSTCWANPAGIIAAALASTSAAIAHRHLPARPRPALSCLVSSLRPVCPLASCTVSSCPSNAFQPNNCIVWFPALSYGSQPSTRARPRQSAFGLAADSSFQGVLLQDVWRASPDANFRSFHTIIACRLACNLSLPGQYTRGCRFVPRTRLRIRSKTMRLKGTGPQLGR